MILCHGNANVCISTHPRIIDNKKQNQRYIHNRIPDGLQPSSNQEITQEDCKWKRRQWHAWRWEFSSFLSQISSLGRIKALWLTPRNKILHTCCRCFYHSASMWQYKSWGKLLSNPQAKPSWQRNHLVQKVSTLAHMQFIRRKSWKDPKHWVLSPKDFV